MMCSLQSSLPSSDDSWFIPDFLDSVNIPVFLVIWIILDIWTIPNHSHHVNIPNIWTSLDIRTIPDHSHHVNIPEFLDLLNIQIILDVWIILDVRIMLDVWIILDVWAILDVWIIPDHSHQQVDFAQIFISWWGQCLLHLNYDEIRSS